VRTAFPRIDIIGKGKDRLCIAVIVLKRDFRKKAVLFTRNINRLGCSDVLFLFSVRQRIRCPFIKEFLILVGSFIHDGYPETPVEKCQLPQPLGKDIITEVCHLENLRIGLNVTLVPCLLSCYHDKRTGRLPRSNRC